MNKFDEIKLSTEIYSPKTPQTIKSLQNKAEKDRVFPTKIAKTKKAKRLKIECVQVEGPDGSFGGEGNTGWSF